MNNESPFKAFRREVKEAKKEIQFEKEKIIHNRRENINTSVAVISIIIAIIALANSIYNNDSKQIEHIQQSNLLLQQRIEYIYVQLDSLRHNPNRAPSLYKTPFLFQTLPKK